MTFGRSSRAPHGEFTSPPLRTIRVSVWGIDGLLQNVTGHLILDDDTRTSIPSSSASGRLLFVTTATGGAVLMIAAAGYEPYSARTTLEDNLDVDLEPLRPFSQPLHAEGQFFATPDGLHTIIGCSDFTLFYRYAMGQSIDDVLDERIDLGFNDLRVWFGVVFLPQLTVFDPRPHLGRLRDFCDKIGTRGLGLELTTHTAAMKWIPDAQQQRDLLHEVDRLLPAWVRIEGMNEGLHKSNTAEGIYDEQLSRTWALGSRIQDAGTMEPVKTYGTYHPSRSVDWPRKVGHNAMEDVGEKYGIPAVSNECKRPDEDGYHEQNFFDAAANAALLCAGATFHSESGKASTLFTPEEYRCADAWVRGAKAVPLLYQRGRYTRGGLSACPIVHKNEWSIRTHVRILGNRACCSVPQQTKDWRLQPVNGWRVVVQNESVIELER